MSQLNYKIFQVYQYSDLKRYFKKIPSSTFIIEKLLPCFGYKTLEDKEEINSCLLIPINEKIKLIIPELCTYINDVAIKKAYIYNNVTFYKIIVLFKNFLNCVGMTIKRRKINYGSTTRVYYSMLKLSNIENSTFMEIQNYPKEPIEIKATLRNNNTALSDKFKILSVKKLLEF